MRHLIVIPLLLLALPAAAQVYKCEQADGSVIYTDQKCSDDAQPMDLPELTVMDSPKPSPQANGGQGSGGDGEVPKVYMDLTLLSPRPDQTYQGTGNTLPVRMASRQSLRGTDQVAVFLDGIEQGTFGSMSVDLQDVPRGSHELRVEIRDRQGRVVGDAGPVTFHMKQHSRLHQNQPMVNPPNPGGGS